MDQNIIPVVPPPPEHSASSSLPQMPQQQNYPKKKSPWIKVIIIIMILIILGWVINLVNGFFTGNQIGNQVQQRANIQTQTSSPDSNNNSGVPTVVNVIHCEDLLSKADLAKVLGAKAEDFAVL